MSAGMLGKLPLSAVRGPRDTLEQCLAGENGERWLKAFNQFLRGENPWPIVSKVVDRGYKIAVGDGKTLDEQVHDSCSEIDFDASDVIRSSQFTLEVDKADYDIVMLEFDNLNIYDVDFQPQHVFAEMRRLELEPPSFEDALRFMGRYLDELRFRVMQEIVFLHQPIHIVPNVGPGGMAIGTGEDGRIPAVLALRDNTLRGNVITTVNTSLLNSHRIFAARRFRPQDK